jgi:hypothetical protein
MSRIREAHHRLLELLGREPRREDEKIRDEQEATQPSSPEEADGPEIDDLPLGVPPEPEQEDEVESPGFPRGDPSHG